MKCRGFVELVTAYLEDALTAGERALVDAHLSECDDCAAFLVQFLETIDAVAALRRDG
jgi:anti-sigma factor RsiW